VVLYAAVGTNTVCLDDRSQIDEKTGKCGLGSVALWIKRFMGVEVCNERETPSASVAEGFGCELVQGAAGGEIKRATVRSRRRAVGEEEIEDEIDGEEAGGKK
jgi:hypothetical protein